MSGGRVQAIADCMDRPRLYERHLVPVMTLARTGLFFEGFCGSAMRFCITSRQRGSAVPAPSGSSPRGRPLSGREAGFLEKCLTLGWKGSNRRCGRRTVRKGRLLCSACTTADSGCVYPRLAARGWRLGPRPMPTGSPRISAPTP
jgi:hypothetical protein